MFRRSLNNDCFNYFIDSIDNFDAISVSLLVKREKVLTRASAWQRIKICETLHKLICEAGVHSVLGKFDKLGELKLPFELLMLEDLYFEKTCKKFFPNIYRYFSNRVDQSSFWVEKVAESDQLTLFASAYMLDKVTTTSDFSKKFFETLVGANPKAVRLIRRYNAWAIKRAFQMGQPLSEYPNAHAYSLELLAKNDLELRELKLLCQLTDFEKDTQLSVGVSKSISILEKQEIENPDSEAYLVKACVDAESGDASWLSAINKYLTAQEVSSLVLSDVGATRFSRIGFEGDRPKCSVSISMQPLVSIIMPAFNAEQWIDQAITSLLQQSWQNLEIIVVDDCSEDATYDLACRHGVNDKRVRVVQNPQNSGAYISRNHGLSLAKGKFVTVNDADDISMPRRIEEHVVDLMETPNLIANFSMLLRVTETGKLACDHLGRYKRMNSSSFMFYREAVLQRCGYWQVVKYGGDSEFIDRVGTIFGRDAIGKSDKPLMVCFYSDANMTNRFGNVLSGGSSDRPKYRKMFSAWHAEIANDDNFSPVLPFEVTGRFEMPDSLKVDAALAGHLADVVIKKSGNSRGRRSADVRKFSPKS